MNNKKSADKHTKSLREKQQQIMFNLLKIRNIKTTFFNLKDVVFVNKIADCRKSARARASTRRVGQWIFWKILAIVRSLVRQRFRLARKCTVVPFSIKTGLFQRQ